MSNEQEFPSGLIVKPPHERAPDFVKAAISIKRAELISWLEGRAGDWVNLDIKESRNGKWYASVNDYKPKEGKPEAQAKPRQQEPVGDASGGFADDPDIPFRQLGKRCHWVA